MEKNNTLLKYDGRHIYMAMVVDVADNDKVLDADWRVLYSEFEEAKDAAKNLCKAFSIPVMAVVCYGQITRKGEPHNLHMVWHKVI